MASKSFEEVLRDLRNKIYAPVYLLTGDEPYFIDQISQFIESNVLDDSEKEFNQTVVYGRDMDALQLLSIAKRYPMMSNYQVVVVREAQEMKALTGKENDDEGSSSKKDKNPLVDYFSNPLQSTVLVLCMKYKSPDKRTRLYKAIDKGGIIFTGKRLYDDKIAGWIETYLKGKKIKIQPEAAQLMAEHLGNDLSRIANECDKLLFNIKEGQPVTIDDVATNIGVSKEFNIFELQDALAQKDILKANRIVNYFGANPKANPLIMTISTLNSFFSKMMVVHTSTDKSDAGLAAALKINPYFIRTYKLAARNYTYPKTTEIIGLLREYDLKSKGVNSLAEDNDLLRELTYRILH